MMLERRAGRWPTPALRQAEHTEATKGRDTIVNRPIPLLLALFVLVTGLQPAARADLDAYLARPEPAFRWEKRG
jgi:hypothetical protein